MSMDLGYSSFDLGVPAGIQNIFYAIASIPAILGAALIVAGIIIVVKYRNR